MEINIKKRIDVDPQTGRLKKVIVQNRTRLEQIADLGKNRKHALFASAFLILQ